MKNSILTLFLLISSFMMAKNDSNNKAADPPKITGFKIVNNTDTNESYFSRTTFSWDAPSASSCVSDFVIYLKRTGGTYSPFLVPGGRNATSVFFEDDVINRPYNYEIYIVARCNGVEGPQNTQSTHILYEPTPFTSAPSAPALVSKTADTNSFKITWTPPTSGSSIVGYWVSVNNSPVSFAAPSQNTGYTVTGLHPNNIYAVAVAAMDTYGSVSPLSTATSITTLDYCKPSTTPQDTDNYNANAYIQQVSIASMLTYPAVARTSNILKNTYNNFTDGEIILGNIPTLTLGSAKQGNIIKVTAAPIGGLETDVVIYIDFDFDGVFEDSERVACGFLSYKNSDLSKSMTDNVPVTFVSDVINVPSTAFVGTVRMRIMYQQINTNWNASNLPINSCDFIDPSIGGYVNVGEIEDYSVTIINPNNPVYGRGGNSGSDIIIQEPVAQDSKPEKPDPTNLTIYPNPVSGDFMNITAIDNNTPYAIYNVAGQEVSTGKVNNGTISVANLSKGNYLLQVQVNDQRIVKQFIKQ